MDGIWTLDRPGLFVKLEKLTKDLQFDSTEEIGEFADRVSQINQKILDSTEAGLRFAEVIKFLPETSKRYLLQISELNEDCFQITFLLLVAQSEFVFGKLENVNLKTLKEIQKDQYKIRRIEKLYKRAIKTNITRIKFKNRTSKGTVRKSLGKADRIDKQNRSGFPEIPVHRFDREDSDKSRMSVR